MYQDSAAFNSAASYKNKPVGLLEDWSEFPGTFVFELPPAYRKLMLFEACCLFGNLLQDDSIISPFRIITSRVET